MSTEHTLSNGTITATLPAGMIWEDEYQYAPLTSTSTQTLDGGMVIEQSLRTKGRPVTLVGDEDRGWLAKAQLDLLYALASSVGALTLTLADGRVLAVMFSGAQPIQARGLWPLALPSATDMYVVKLSLIQV